MTNDEILKRLQDLENQNKEMKNELKIFHSQQETKKGKSGYCLPLEESGMKVMSPKEIRQMAVFLNTKPDNKKIIV